MKLKNNYILSSPATLQSDKTDTPLRWVRDHITAEYLLLILAGVFMFVNYLSLFLLNPQRGILHWLPVIVWAICAYTGSYLLKQHLPDHNQLIFPAVMLLTGWGLASIDRLIPAFADRQTIWLIIALVGLLTVAILPQPLRWLRNYRYLWLLLGLILLSATIIFGTNPSGTAGSPQLWLGIGTVFFQPSEMLKILLIVFLSSYLGEEYPLIRAENTPGESKRFNLTPRIIGPIVLMFGLTLVTLVWQRDLGTATLFFLIFIVLMYAASGNLLIFLGGGISLAIIGFIAYNLFVVVQLRVDIWIDPWSQADGNAFQIVQSLQAVAAGGIFGQGIGQGAPYYIPVVHSDFIFAAIAEEWGLLGIITLIITLFIILWSGLRSAIHQTNAFYSLLAIGLSSIIAMQSILIMGGVVRLLPLTGVTLPFVSYGGSSLLMSFISIGLLIRLSTKER